MHHRSGKINTLWLLLLGGAGAIVACVLLLNIGPPRTPTATPVPASRGNSGNGTPAPTAAAPTLSMYCAAGLRDPVEKIAAMYEREFGVKVDLQYGGSNSLLSQIQVNKFDTSDLFLAAEESYIDIAKEKGFAVETFPVATQQPVVVVRKDRGKKISSFDDLLAEGVSVVTGNPDQAAIGKAVKHTLEAATVGDTNRWAQLEPHITKTGVFKPTVHDAANDVKLGAIDVGIIWDSTAAMPAYRDEFDVIHLAEFDSAIEQITLCVLKSSPQPTAALQFARYLTARDRGLPVFAEFGAKPIADGDTWSAKPELNFYCGAVNRRAVEKILEQFEEREGVKVNTIYDGCGILTCRMKTIADQKPELGFPDVYMACDVYYLDNVRDWFQEAANVSDTSLVIAVPKGSDKVKTLPDLLKPGVRVSVGQPEQCTIGALTERMLAADGLYDKLLAKQRRSGEVVVEKSSSALLVPDVLTGHVDATIAFATDVKEHRDKVDVVEIDSTLNVAVQPFSIARTSNHKYLSRRLFERVASSPAAFENAGFHFRLPGGAATSDAPQVASP